MARSAGLLWPTHHLLQPFRLAKAGVWHRIMDFLPPLMTRSRMRERGALVAAGRTPSASAELIARPLPMAKGGETEPARLGQFVARRCRSR